jgi:dTMP kinase
MSGVFISLDGVDGGGKSTQVRLLAEYLQTLGHDVLTFRDPGGTKLGEALREILLHRQEIPLIGTAEMLLYMASRAELVAECIQPAIESGKTVITDRFLLANVVYQGCAGGLDPSQLWQVGEIATGGLQPDLTIVLDIAVEQALGRIERGFDRLESRGTEYMEKVRRGFLEQVSHLGMRAVVVDANAAIEAVQSQIRTSVDRLLAAKK